MEETELAGASWQINTLSATKGVEVLTWLGAILGQGAGHLGSALQSMEKPKAEKAEDQETADADADESTKSPLDIDMSWKDVGEAAGAILGRLSDPKTPAMLKTLLADLHKDKKQVRFDEEFAANYGVLAQIVAWALTVNFQSFFTGNPVVRGIAQKAGTLFPTART